jgi:hypothetical protein
LDVQNGVNLYFDPALGGTVQLIELDRFDPQRRFIRNLRDLANYVHFDALYEAYLNACLILLNIRAPFDPAFDPGNPYILSRTQDGFGTFGAPHILSLVTEVATRALKAVWFQKWGVHRRLRSEEFGGRIHVHLRDLPPRAFLPYAGHPGLAAGRYPMLNVALVALGAPPPQLTVGGELNKLAANISLGRNAAGVHWRSDYTESVSLGEEIAIGLLQEQKLTYNEPHHFSLTRFDGTVITI